MKVARVRPVDAGDQVLHVDGVAAEVVAKKVRRDVLHHAQRGVETRKLVNHCAEWEGNTKQQQKNNKLTNKPKRDIDHIVRKETWRKAPLDSSVSTKLCKGDAVNNFGDRPDGDGAEIFLFRAQHAVVRGRLDGVHDRRNLRAPISRGDSEQSEQQRRLNFILMKKIGAHRRMSLGASKCKHEWLRGRSGTCVA